MNGQYTVPNLKQLLTYLDLSAFGPKVELMQHVFNHTNYLRTYMGLPMDIASVLEEPMAEDPKVKMKTYIPPSIYPCRRLV